MLFDHSMDFGGALKALKEGKAVERRGWNGKGLFVYLVTGGNYPVQMDIVKPIAEKDGTLKYNPYMAIKNMDGSISTWVPSVNDCLAEDWFVVNPENQASLSKLYMEQAKVDKLKERKD